MRIKKGAVLIALLAVVLLIWGLITVGKTLNDKIDDNNNDKVNEEIIYDDFVNVDKFFVYGENLTINIDEVLINTDIIIGEDSFPINELKDKKLNEQIFLPNIEVGNHEIYLRSTNDEIKNLGLNFESFEEIDMYTVTRDGFSKHITIYQDIDKLMMNVELVDILPEDVCDVVIDAGHGGPDVGAVSKYLGYEADLVLDLSFYMRDKFEENGLKACLTRTDSGIPGHIEVDDSYADGGRIDLIFWSNAKYLFSNHLNSSPQGHVGSEVYSSVRTNDILAKSFADAIVEAGGRYSVNQWLQYDLGTYKRYPTDYDLKYFRDEADIKGFKLFEYFDNEDPKNIDYYFIIRETGGVATDAYNDGRKPDLEANNHIDSIIGLEAYLLEYAYIDNEEDAKLYDENKYKYVDAIVNEFLNHLNK